MDFTTMGTVTSYIKQKNLRFAADYKVHTGQRLADSEGNLEITKSTEQDQFMESRDKTNEEIGIAKLASIKQRLASGNKLSNEDMSYLQQKNPGTYKKAKRADEAREELKGELKKAKTKQEARQAVTKAMIKASAEASADIAACKSDTKSDLKNNTNKISNVEIKSAVTDTAEKNFSDSSFQNLATSNDYYSGNGKIEYASELFAEPAKVSNKNIAYHSGEKSDTPQNVMQRFIMTIRALEAEWAQFTKSKEYDNMPNDRNEEYLLRMSGERHEICTPDKKVLGAVNAYRNSMMYKEANILAEMI